MAPGVRDPLDHRPGYDGVQQLRPLAPDLSNLLNLLALAGLWGSGALHRAPGVWYRQAGRLVWIVLGLHLSTAGLFQLVARRFGQLIQTSPTAQKEYYAAELVQTVLGFGCVLGPLLAWAGANAEIGLPTALKYEIDEVFPVWMAGGGLAGRLSKQAIYIALALVGAVGADAYNYWKHRLFHTELLWPFHRHHHAHRNPSALTGYAISPIYSLATFWPLALSAVPAAGFYVPVYMPVLGFYFLLNHYLHCGYVLWWLERPLAPLGVMTSNYHNTHHNRGRRGFYEGDQTFGEMTIWWDWWMDTHPAARKRNFNTKS